MLLLLLAAAGCNYVEQADRDVSALIRARQQSALGYEVPVQVGDDVIESQADAFARNPRPTTIDIPPGFEAPPDQPAIESPPRGASATTAPAITIESAADSDPLTRPHKVLTLIDALAYAQRNRRAYQTAKEDLFLVALALTLERHLWTPIFASELRTVYGNFGQVRDFDQAMRFVADLAVSQRLPFGGEFTAKAISTLIRDVKRSLTATEDSSIELGLSVPLLRGAGHVAREQLIQLERDLTYAVRSFERFRREQLVLVAQDYFDLLRTKQNVIDSKDSLERAIADYQRALEVQELPGGDPLDTLRAEQRKLSQENSLESARNAFRAQADRFKIEIGMPVDEPLGLEDLEDIETIERKIASGEYPVLRRPPAASDEPYALDVALSRRFDLLTLRDRIDDARRGVAVARNNLLPDLAWDSTVTWYTDPEQGRLGGFHFDRTTWRTEMILELPLERTAERNALRRSLIDVRQAQRFETDRAEGIRAEVRRAINAIRLAETSLRIQRRNLEVAENRAEYAALLFEDGKITNRDKIEAEAERLDALNALNLAKTSRWNALLEFRLSTETLRIDEDGVQYPDPNVD